MRPCELHLFNAMASATLDMLRRLLALEFLVAQLERIKHDTAHGDRQQRQQDCFTHWVFGLLALTTTGPTLRLLGPLFLAHDGFESSVLGDDLDGFAIMLYPIESSLEKHSAQILRDAFFYFAGGTASSRCVCELCVIRTADRKQLAALVARRIHLDEHFPAHEGQTPKWRHLVGLGALGRTTPHALLTSPLLPLRPVEHVLLHAWQLASAAVSVHLGTYWHRQHGGCNGSCMQQPH
mmetsp:Transcript_65657/g.129150  ORF Transcript_65657/g.129150 Transcript_65657/m.129150 type:complete len:237 (+) Transcript_65657:517-1227(+)